MEREQKRDRDKERKKERERVVSGTFYQGEDSTLLIH